MVASDPKKTPKIEFHSAVLAQGKEGATAEGENKTMEVPGDVNIYWRRNAAACDLGRAEIFSHFLVSEREEKKMLKKSKGER